MITEKHDPWALLRDAREWLGHGLPCATICGECIVIDRIDAALAEHDAEERVDSATPVVEWHRTETRPTVYHSDLDGSVMEIQLGAERWHWEVTREGDEPTLDEAKAAAIEAARGLR